jgi:hypothetical protein
MVRTVITNEDIALLRALADAPTTGLPEGVVVVGYCDHLNGNMRLARIVRLGLAVIDADGIVRATEPERWRA